MLIKSKMVGFWQRLVNGKQDKLSNKLMYSDGYA